MRSRLLHVGDLHLGDRHDYLGPAAATRRSEADLVLRRVIDFALAEENRIAALVIAGDLFDHHRPPHALVESVLVDLARAVEAGIAVITVPGNHDEWSYPDCVYRHYAARWPGTLVVQPNAGLVSRLEIAGAMIELYALAYVAGRTRFPFEPPPLAPSNARRLLIAHGSLDVDWSDRALPLRSAALGGFHYVALGHIHKPMEKRLPDGFACYPGRIEGGSFDDPGTESLVVIDFASSELRPERLPFPSRAIVREEWNLSGLRSLDELRARLARLAEQRSGMIARIELRGLASFPLPIESLVEELRPSFFFLELVDAREEAASGRLEDLATEPTIRGAFARRALKAILEAEDEEDRALAEAAARYGLAAFAARAPAPTTTSGEAAPGATPR